MFQKYYKYYSFVLTYVKNYSIILAELADSKMIIVIKKGYLTRYISFFSKNIQKIFLEKIV